ncbi:MAG TPA: hypothetical protein VFV87_04990 [Pirellulaceae bacterium]|nr:hypothetical protein [Pirellulaceae bacterium]
MKFAPVFLLLAVAASPALAGDGQIPQSKLQRLGLGQMQTMSDSQGMEVRGQSSGVMAGGLSLVFGILQDPANPGNFVGATDLNTAMASAENAGLQVLSTSQVTQGSAISTSLNVITPVSSFAGVLFGLGGNAAAPGIGGFSFGSAQ